LFLACLLKHHELGKYYNRTRRYKHCPNFPSSELFLIETYSSLYSFTIANQKSVRYSVSISYFRNIAVQNVNKAFVYITDFTASLNRIEIIESYYA
jgi:hypothetical protein